jgi:hypothetical protein
MQSEYQQDPAHSHNHPWEVASLMPLARIFTRNPERTADLSSQLKQQGYSVEVTHPDQANLAPADLEIEFEICERADVLDRAADLASELGADVAVAPGILQMASKLVAEPAIVQPIAAEPVIVEPIIAQSIAAKAVVSQPTSSEPAVSEQVISKKIQRTPLVAESMPEDVLGLESPTVAEHDPERDFEAAFAPAIEMEMPPAVQANQEVINARVIEHEPMPPVAFLQESPAPEPIAAVPLAENYPEARMAERFPATSAVFPKPSHSADPMPSLAQLAPFTIPASRTSETSKEDKQQRSLPLVRPQDPPQILRGNKALQDGARIAAHTWAGALALAASTTASVRDHFEEYRKRAQVRSAETRAAHAARLLDLEQRRAEAHHRAAELERAREQAAARLLELVRQREPGLPPERLRESMAFEPSAPVQSQPYQSYYKRPLAQERRRETPPVAPSRPEPAAKLRRASITATPIELWRSINPPLRSVLTGAAAVSALFIMGIALGLFHSRPQMASTPNRSANGVTVKTGGVTVAAAKPQAAQPSAGTPRPAQRATAAQTAKPSPRVRQARLVAGQSEKQIGDDVVIRHYTRPVPTQKPKQAGQQAGLKHFSDLEN